MKIRIKIKIKIKMMVSLKWKTLPHKMTNSVINIVIDTVIKKKAESGVMRMKI